MAIWGIPQRKWSCLKRFDVKIFEEEGQGASNTLPKAPLPSSEICLISNA